MKNEFRLSLRLLLVLSICIFTALCVNAQELTTEAAAEAVTEVTTTEPTTTEPTTTEPTTSQATEYKLTVNPGELTIGCAESFTLKVRDRNGLNPADCSFSSSNEAVCVNALGEVTGLSQGSAEITVTTSDGGYGTCLVNVLPGAQQVSLNATALILGLGESFDFNSYIPEGSGAYWREYSCSDNKVLTYQKSGIYKATGIGTAKVFVTLYNGVRAECTVTVRKAADKVYLNSKGLTIGIGESFNFNSSVPSGLAAYARRYSCSDSSVLSYHRSGIFKGEKSGTATVYVTLFNGVKAACKVTVLPAAKKVTLNSGSSLRLNVGDIFNFNASVAEKSGGYWKKYSCTDNGVLSYFSGGIYRAEKTGTATVTVTLFNGVKTSCRVEVLPLPSSIASSRSTYTLEIGHTLKSSVSFPDGGFCRRFTYSSSDSSVAYCDNKGVIHALKMGSCRITVKSSNGKTCSFNVNVTAMKVPYVSQRPTYPTGCEGASCTSVMKYYGYDISLHQMIDTIPRKNIYYKNGKRYGPDINEYFVGDPRGGYTSSVPGYGAFSPCVTKSLQKAIDKRGGEHKAVKITGCSFDELLGYLSEGKPVIVWATYRMQIPTTVNSWYIIGTGKYFEYPRGTHVMVLTGYSDSRVTVIDPYNGEESYSITTFEKRWKLLGRQGVILE